MKIFELIISLILLIVLLPLIVIISLAIYLAMGRPIFFYQKRIGLSNKQFTIIKFRTMKSENLVEENDSVRITALGRLLRITSLDEIPSIINVIKGDMAFVGPRPLLVEYLHLYNDFQIKRHLVKPGITGWAQINGRNQISWEEKFKLDIWYVENKNLMLDLKILFLTVYKVFKRDGINQSDTITAKRFTGKN